MVSCRVTRCTKAVLDHQVHAVRNSGAICFSVRGRVLKSGCPGSDGGGCPGSDGGGCPGSDGVRACGGGYPPLEVMPIERGVPRRVGEGYHYLVTQNNTRPTAGHSAISENFWT